MKIVLLRIGVGSCFAEVKPETITEIRPSALACMSRGGLELGTPLYSEVKYQTTV